VRGFSGTMNKALQNKHHKVKVAPDIRGCPPVSSGKKNCKHAILKENTANYISLERLINVDFGKKNQLPVF